MRLPDPAPRGRWRTRTSPRSRTQVMTTGEGGIIVTCNDALAKQMVWPASGPAQRAFHLCSDGPGTLSLKPEPQT
jgi:hypothetical protein